MNNTSLLALLTRGNRTLFEDGGRVSGPGTGISDSVPATIEGRQPARLSDGEYVLTAEVVSKLGGGSTDAGAQILDQFMEIIMGMEADDASVFSEAMLSMAQTIVDETPKIEDTESDDD